MKTVYLVRHGESSENIRSAPTFEGGEATLSELGKRQALGLAARMQNLPIECIVTSTMARAIETGNYISDATGVAAEATPIFAEAVSPTSFIGRKWDDDGFEADLAAWHRTLFTSDAKFEDGENFEEMRERAEKALVYLASRTENHIVVVTHGFFLRFLAGLVLLRDALDPDDIEHLRKTLVTRNTGITVIQSGNPGFDVPWQMLTWNDHAHLG